jgi:hypothetical protein
VLEDIPKPSELCRVSGRNGGQFSAACEHRRKKLKLFNDFNNMSLDIPRQSASASIVVLVLVL